MKKSLIKYFLILLGIIHFIDFIQLVVNYNTATNNNIIGIPVSNIVYAIFKLVIGSLLLYSGLKNKRQ